MKKYYSISALKEDGIYEIHPCNNDTVSGYIKVENGLLFDNEINELYTSEDILKIEIFEEENCVYYVKL